LYSILHKSIRGNGNVAPAPLRLNVLFGFGASGVVSAFALSGAIIATIVAIISNDAIFVVIELTYFVIYLPITNIDFGKTIHLYLLYRKIMRFAIRSR
jgi:hypothetical protein